MTSNVSTIILDYDGVIRYLDLKASAELLHEHGMDAQTFFNMVFDPLIQQLVVGEINRLQWWQMLQEKYPSLEEFDPAFLWETVMAKNYFNIPLLEFLSRKKQDNTNLRCVVLSNADAVSKVQIKEEMADHPIDDVFTSSDFGVAKPSPQVFIKLLGAIKAQPGECLFLDDKKANVETALQMGIRSAHIKEDYSFDEVVNIVQSQLNELSG